MDTDLVMQLRNIMISSLVLASGALLPEAPASLSRFLAIRWNRIKWRLQSLLPEKPGPEPQSFLEIDMSKLEP